MLKFQLNHRSILEFCIAAVHAALQKKNDGFQPRGPAQKFTFSREGCRKLQNLERHAGPEAKQNALLASTGIEILWFATPSEREREFRTCLKIVKINRRFL